MVVAKIPDATPGLITKYALDDEQALLAKLRYNRFMAHNVIALFQFEQIEEGVGMSVERHYKLVTLDQLSLEELERDVQRALQS